MARLGRKLNVKKSKKPASPVYDGWDLYRDGITQSLLSKFYIDRHRFWIRTVLLLSQAEGFSHRMEYGSLFHAGFEAFAKAKNAAKFSFEAAVKAGRKGIQSYGQHLRSTFPEADSVLFWTSLAERQFEIYCNHWKQKDAERQYLFQEEVFNVPITLPSGRVIPIRGKYDEIFLEKAGKRGTANCVLQENKVKGEVDEEGIGSSLHLDLQTMFYLLAIQESGLVAQHGGCLRLLYNVILRPAGGRYPLRQKKSETKLQFADRLIDICEKNPNNHFHRWYVSITESELSGFKTKVLFPILEELADWWDSISDNPYDPFHASRGSCGFNPHHHLRPFGIFDSLALGNRGDYFDFLISNGINKSGLKKRPLFEELSNASLSERK